MKIKALCNQMFALASNYQLSEHLCGLNDSQKHDHGEDNLSLEQGLRELKEPFVIEGLEAGG